MDSKSIIRRAYRTLRHLSQYRHLADVPSPNLPEGLRSILMDPQGEKIIGIYENKPGRSEESILITSLGLYIKQDGTYSIAKYEEITGISPPKDKGSEKLIIHTVNNTQEIYIRGGASGFKDIFEFMHFLQRVTNAHLVNSGREEPPPNQDEPKT